jgi:acetyltransferase-like isoleucine patch superfamily enzyme
MPRQLRLLVAALIALVPIGRLRIALYRRLLGYQIGADCRIGMFNLIACRTLRLGAGSVIGRGNLIKGDFHLATGPRMFVGNLNVMTCPWRLAGSYAARMNFGENCLVNDRHYFDGHGLIAIGDRTWIAGRDTQLYTHGISVADRDIAIGSDCFIGSAARFAPGSGIGDRNVVGIGSVVLDRIDADAALITGFPARPVRDISAALAAGRYRFSKDDWGSGAS